MYIYIYPYILIYIYACMCVCVCTSVRRRRRRDCTAMYNRRKGHLNPVHFNYRPNVLNITVVMGGGGCGEGRGVVRGLW